MCGIAAYFSPGAFDPTPFLANLAHRGPDSHGVWSAGLGGGNWIHLIHTRLAILDLSPQGNQPMRLTPAGGGRWRTLPAGAAGATDQTGERGGYAIAYNGEIYNFAELRAELQAHGHIFTSSGDTEVLLRGYAEWGRGVFARLDGMFSVLIYDGPARRLVVARDHVGIKPLYFARSSDGGYLFASEVRTITGSGMWDGQINRTAILDYLRFGSFQEPATAFAGIWAFEPGTVGWVNFDDGVPGILLTEPYWKIEESAAEDRERRDWPAEHGEFLRRTVAEQLVADVPVGIFLSGGIDSTLLLEMAATSAQRDRLTAFTVGGDLTTNQEASIAARTAANLGVRHLMVHLTGTERRDWVLQALRSMDLPTCDGVNTFIVSHASRAAGLVVALSGTGADELHGAYGHATDLARLVRLMHRFGPLARSFGQLVTRFAGLTSGSVARERLGAMLEQAHSPWRVLQEKRRFFTGPQIAELWPEGSTIPLRWHSPVPDEAQLARLADETQITISEIRGYLLNTLLRDSDWATMANQQELRVPYLGRRYLEFMLRMPASFKAPHGVIKKPLLADLISPANRALVSQPKQGFTMNYAEMLLGQLQAEFLAGSAWLNAQLDFRLDAPARLAELRANPTSKMANRLWALFALGNYLERHTRDARPLAAAGYPVIVPTPRRAGQAQNSLPAT
jgi:asparagine synthase (glutamine-hydrolysing)